MNEHICPSCGQFQHSLTDQAYLRLFKRCWREDCEFWRAGQLLLDEFERREKAAAAEAARVHPFP